MAVTTLTFDPCICELYWPLAYGARVYIVSSSTQKRPDKMVEVLDAAKPTILQVTEPPTLIEYSSSTIHLCTLTLTLASPLCIILVVMMRAKEFKTSRFVLMLILWFTL